ncbi:hypothetical protein IKF03_02450 [Candidatus Saccharibacteria bacterium]|nr:hypothetical protein [Candidatus Saccharibacteria bacterium]
MTEALKLPNKVINADWTVFQLIGGDEKGERNYQNMTLIKKSEVKNTTTNYKERKIGHTAIYSIKDKLAA